MHIGMYIEVRIMQLIANRNLYAETEFKIQNTKQNTSDNESKWFRMR